MFNFIQYNTMSLKIIKAGMLDSIQDLGRFGYRQYGINPTGVMDSYASRMANFLVGNEPEDAVIELHFPASAFLFSLPAVIALTGADFSATIDEQFVPHHKAVTIPEKSVLRFTNHINGARCYLAVAGGFELTKWLDSYSTNFKAAIGGFQGTRLRKDDIILFAKKKSDRLLIDKLRHIQITGDETQPILVLPGNEWNWLSENEKEAFIRSEFIISPQSDRMGYKLVGNKISPINKMELVSSPVCFGTIQLLPDGNLILLMADHQTTGGYPGIATVITAHHSILAQKRPGSLIHFALTDIMTAEKLLFKKEEEFISLQNI